MTRDNIGQPTKRHKKCEIWRWNCLQAPYQRFMYKYGLFVAKHPWWFVIVPLVICLSLATGLYFNMITYSSAIGLYCPQHSETYESESRVTELFPTNSSQFVARALVDSYMIMLLAEATNGNVLDELNLHQIFTTDHFIRRNLTTSSGTTFEDLCAKWRGECVVVSPFIENNNMDVNTIPVAASSNSFTTAAKSVSSTNILNRFLGEITLGVDGKSVQKARYMAWYVFMRDDMKAHVKEWMTMLDDRVEKKELDNSDVKIAVDSSFYVDRIVARQGTELTRGFVPALAMMIVFSMLSCLMLDPVRSKPWLTVAGVMSPGLAIGGSFGLLLYAGQPLSDTVGLAPFLVIGIGVDGMFVLLSAWRRTSPYLTCEQRMALTFREGGVSITITALTDIVSMAVGIVNPFRAIEQFCRFAALATTFDLILQLTFFGGCLALTGQREETNRHSLIPCLVLPAPSQARDDKSCRKIFCVGGVNKSHRSSLDNKQHLGSKFFGKVAVKWIRKPYVIAIAVFLYISYVGGAVYGILNMQEELKIKDISLIGSKYYEMGGILESYFLSERFLMLVFDEQLTYSAPADQRKMSSLIAELTLSEEAHLQIGPSWIQAYTDFLEEQGIQPANESEYIGILRKRFLANPLFEQFKVDFVFNSDFSNILSSRIYLIYYNLQSTKDQAQSLIKIRKILQQYDLNVFVFHYLNYYIEQYIQIRPNIMQILAIAFVSIIVIALVFLPNPLITLLIAMSVASILAGLVGYMSLWDVRLDVIAMLALLITIGFIVDFSAHLAYVFVTKQGQDKLKYALTLVGFPLLQSSVSTIVGTAMLSITKAPSGIIFSKIMFILMISGIFHGLLWIPLSLQFIMLRCHKPKTDNRRGIKTPSKDSPKPLSVERRKSKHSRRQRVSLQTVNFSKNRKLVLRANLRRVTTKS